MLSKKSRSSVNVKNCDTLRGGIYKHHERNGREISSIKKELSSVRKELNDHVTKKPSTTEYVNKKKNNNQPNQKVIIGIGITIIVLLLISIAGV